jgi:DNA-directed RNA polymerase alpha subunit
MNDIENSFIADYTKKEGFWYTFKRTAAELDKIYAHFNLFKSFENKKWNENQNNFSKILNDSNLLTLHTATEGEANARGYKKLFEQLGLSYENTKGIIIITEIGEKFLNSSNKEFEIIKTEQLIKYQVYNPFIDSNIFKVLKIKPYVYLLNILNVIENNYITFEEFKLFVFRSYNKNELNESIEYIKWWRSLSDLEKNKIIFKIKKLKKSSRGAYLYDKISGYVGYSANFFGVSYFTNISELDEEKIIYIKKDKVTAVQVFLKNLIGLNDFKEFESTDNYIKYYGSDRNLLKSTIFTKEEHLNRKIEDIMFLNTRTTNALKEQNIITLSDLLSCNKFDLLNNKNVGLKTLDDIVNSLNIFNQNNNTSFLIKETSSQSKNIEKIFNRNLFKRIDELNLSTRIINCLKNEKIFYVGDLVQKTERDMLKTPKFGISGLKEIKNILSEMSLYLGLEVTNWNEKNIEEIKKNYEEEISNEINFDNLDEYQKKRLFIPIETFIHNIRAINFLKSSNVEVSGDLYERAENLLKNNTDNVGRKTIDILKNSIFSIFSIHPFNVKFSLNFTSYYAGGKIKNWAEIKQKYYDKYKKLSNDSFLKTNEANLYNAKFLDEELSYICDLIKFKRFDIIQDLYGLDGTHYKTLQETGDKFKITRERIRQIESKFLNRATNINFEFPILSSILNLLDISTPIKTNDFESLIKEKNLIKNFLSSESLLNLFDKLLDKNNYYITKYFQYRIIVKKDGIELSEAFKFINNNLNKFSCIDLSYVSKKFKVESKFLLNILKINNDYDFIDDNWIYLKNKSSNFLYNGLLKIFNVTNKINKFQLEKALGRSKNIKQIPKFEVLRKYCEKVFKANTNENEIIVDNANVDKFLFNTSRSVITDKEKFIINKFKEKKFKNYFELERDYIESGESAGSASYMISMVSLLILKLAPQTYCLVGTDFTAEEIDEFEKKFTYIRGKKTQVEYDYLNENTIKVSYKINLKNINGNRFKIPNNLKNNLYGDFYVKDSEEKISIEKNLIKGIIFNKFKHLLVINNEIDFIFDLKNKEVVIEKSST